MNTEQMDDLKAKLASLDDTFQKTPIDGELPPDGEYQAIISRFDFFEANTTGDTFLKTEMKVNFPTEYAGWPVEVIHNLTNPDRLAGTKKFLATLGADFKSFGDLLTALEDLANVPVKIAIVTADKINPKTGTNYRNAYVNERLGAPLPASDLEAISASRQDADVAAGRVSSDDDIPF